MRVVPKMASKRLSFFQSRLAKWAQNHADIGLTESEVQDVELKLAAAKEAYRARLIARDQAKSAKLALQIAMKKLMNVGGSAIMKVRATARKDGAKVYPLASVPKPKKRSPIGDPGKPSYFKTATLQDGTVVLKWKCKNPRNAEGTVYEVWRYDRRPGDPHVGDFKFLGIAGKKLFNDTTIPAGVAGVVYRVTAVRSTKRGPAGEYIANFGGVPKMPAAKMQTRAAA